MPPFENTNLHLVENEKTPEKTPEKMSREHEILECKEKLDIVRRKITPVALKYSTLMGELGWHTNAWRDQGGKLTQEESQAVFQQLMALIAEEKTIMEELQTLVSEPEQAEIPEDSTLKTVPIAA